MAERKDTKEIMKDLLYMHVGAMATIAEHLSDKTDEFIEKGKDVTEKGKDLNKELKHKVDEFFEEDKEDKKEEKK